MTISPFFITIKFMKYYYRCIKCNKDFYSLKEIRAHSSAHDPYYEYIDIMYDYDEIKKLPTEQKIKKLCNLLPIDKTPFVLGEGDTPLIRIRDFSSVCENNIVYVKNEGANPSGSFKDRESSVILEKAKEFGYKKVFIVSSGNAALSAAIYANKAKIDCECFVPKETSKAKKLILKLYNSNFHLVDADYETIYRRVIDNPPENSWNITGGQNFFRIEGDKKIAFEIWGKIGVPHYIIVPIGNGALFSAIYKGFKELKKVGLSGKMPKLIGVQIKNAAPVAEALKAGKENVILENVPESVAEGIVARESYSSIKVMQIIKSGGGSIVEVTESEVKRALTDIINKESLTPEPTAAVVYAALNKIEIKGSQQRIVCIQTGSGMKNLEEILETTNKN